MGNCKLFSVVISILMVGTVCVVRVNAAAVDDYNQKCARCHGEDGQGSTPIDGSDCSLKTIEEILECYPLIPAHDYVDECDDTCILETNTYVVDELLFQIGKNQYTEMCAVCHGEDGMGNVPIDGDACDLSTHQRIVDCYPTISAHGNISACDDTCVWYANQYIFIELLDNADIEPSDEAGGDGGASLANGEITVNNDNWVSCFIQACQLK
jgi:hypothetical protein